MPRHPAARRALFAVFSAVAMATSCARSLADESPTKAVQPAADLETGSVPPVLEALCTDGSIVKLKLLDEHLQLKTRYGELLIPAAEIEHVDFATRIPEDVAKRVREAAAKLASDEFEVREAASAELLSFAERAYPAILDALKNDDPEIVFRAEQLLEKLRKSVPEDRLQVRPRDVVRADGSTIGGMLLTESLRVETAQFGRQNLKLSDLRNIRAPGAAVEEAGEVLPDPGSLSQYQGQEGKTLAFRVSAAAGANPFGGGIGGAVWGTDTYTLDSSLATAAMHAGIIRPGQSLVVRVVILGPQNNFQGSFRNGINSSAWGQYPGAFKFKQ